MKAEDLQPNKILRGPIFPEPVQIIGCIPRGDGRSHTGDIALTSNEDNTARRLRKDYWLYVDFRCASPNPSRNILHGHSTLDWQPIAKVEHYRLRPDSVKHPVELKEDATSYRTGGAQ